MLAAVRAELARKGFMAKAAVESKAAAEEEPVRTLRRICDRNPVKLLKWNNDTISSLLSRQSLRSHPSIIRYWGINE
jgi:hypothetical protein